MSRKRPTSIYDDPVQERIAQMRTLLGLIEAIPKVEFSAEALESAGFISSERRPIDPFVGRRALVWIQEREERRKDAAALRERKG